jgi:methyl-accepting chemotaxis protein
LIAGFLVVASITLILGVLGYVGAVKSADAVDEIGAIRLPGVSSLLDLKEVQMCVWVGERGLIHPDMMAPAIRKAQYDFIDEAWKRADEAWKIYEPLAKTPEEAAAWKDFVPAWDKWKQTHGVVRTLSNDKDALVAQGLDLQDQKVLDLDKKVFDASLVARDASLAATKILDNIIHINKDVANEEVTAANGFAAFLKVLSLVAMILGVFLAVGLGILIARGINNALRRIAGNLSAGAEQTASAASQVSSASQSLAQGASEQAAAIEETTSSVEEMASMWARWIPSPSSRRPMLKNPLRPAKSSTPRRKSSTTWFVSFDVIFFHRSAQRKACDESLRRSARPDRRQHAWPRRRDANRRTAGGRTARAA